MNLTGKRFRWWTVIRKNTNGTYLCCCDCGTKRTIPESWLLSGFSTSCGCHKERSKDLRMQEFGYLTAIEPVAEKAKDGSIRWRCVCKCGGETVVSSNKLLMGHTTSCGCKHVKELSKTKTYINGACLEILFSKKLRSNNTSGHTGVHKKGNRWVSFITVGGVFNWLGSYDNYEDAVSARESAEDSWREKLVGSRKRERSA